MKENCEIVEPSIEFKDSFLSALREYTAEGKTLDEGITDPGDDFVAFVQGLKDESQGIQVKPGRVPQTTYWVIDQGGYVGRVSVRHELTENLLRLGGHIGYGIRPSKRGQGYGNRALALVLPRARALGLKRVLLTCDSSNIASKKIIESNGGVLEDEVPGGEGKPTKLRYWIEL